MNIGLLGGAGYFAYRSPGLFRDVRMVGTTAVGLLTVAGMESYAVGKCVSKVGQKERREANRQKSTGHTLSAVGYMVRPGMFGGTLGIGTHHQHFSVPLPLTHLRGALERARQKSVPS